MFDEIIDLAEDCEIIQISDDDIEHPQENKEENQVPNDVEIVAAQGTSSSFEEEYVGKDVGPDIKPSGDFLF